ncbi:MAG: Maf family protein [Methylococcaceae bacterium]|jgi:septum formation protein
MTAQIILASSSPRRCELLDQIKVSYLVKPVDVDETPLQGEQPYAYVQRLAAEKSMACANQWRLELPILAADTAVVLEGQIMGKPRDQEDAKKMLSTLSGKTHQVFTAVSLRGLEHGQLVNVTEVSFRVIDLGEITAYWQTGEPADKAGSYAIQGLGSVFVKAIKGSFSGVMGLPLYETAELLSTQGIRLFK